MTDHDADQLTEEEAKRLWSRAAQLQAEAAGAVQPPAIERDDVTAEGYALAHVREAAVEAGIASRFVEAALADVRAERAVPASRRTSSLARRFLGDPPDSITVRRTIDATPEAVLSAMQAAFASDASRLTLTDRLGEPLDGGVLAFDVGPMRTPFERGFAFETSESGLKQLFVSLRSIDGPTRSCEVTVRSPLTAHGIAFGVGMVVTGIAGAVGLAALGALGFATGVAPVAALGAAGGGLLGGGLGVKGYRALYGFARRRGRDAIDSLLGAVAARSIGGWGGG
jgi:hypothetical protein